MAKMHEHMIFLGILHKKRVPLQENNQPPRKRKGKKEMTEERNTHTLSLKHAHRVRDKKFANLQKT